jgi:hypothetical protein
MANPTVEGFVSDFKTAKAQERGDAMRVAAKQLAALGFDPAGKPLREPEKEAKPAAEKRAAADERTDAAARSEPPKGRAGPASRQSRT